MRIVFMGTPAFAVPSLEKLIEAGHEIVGIFTQPDKPKNRGMKLLPPPVKVCAQEHEIPVYQPTKLRDGTALAQIQALAPELIVVAAYGRILPDEILDYPNLGCINVHSSLLPRYRGAAPINWAILNGDEKTGVTIMHMATELDAGDIITQAETAIDPDEDAETLYQRLADMGGALLISAVEQLAAGTATRTPQEAAGVTLAPMLGRELSPIDWKRSAQEIHNQVRGLIPWPTATTDAITGDTMKILVTQQTGEQTGAPAGTVVAAGKQGIDMACGDGKILRIVELQAAGKKRMKAADYLRGNPISIP
ncbi:methionyl-tRNA formyltransferase [Pseudoflavonifractor sp. DSM 107456]|uniref:Methionyl-tRNA formyltransferase n=1 Tax=Pseudoflavonifractor gallinarum TaxID=2779352 RepID=A0ABR9RAA9_9FIRM|nr:methionyl-tRNA formyltransferase [Pseudoflavonifractor gallinarum]MBE5055330.1 methionyl-tRNA formyltransferase [Pseudoflavonifractor gallinarum]